MKNVTISLDDETHRRARIRAAELGTSLSAMVKQYLEQVSASPDTSANFRGVREMQATFTQAPSVKPATDGLPPGAYGRFPDGTPYYTKDGKPRTPPASLKGKFKMADDFDEWPDEILKAFEHWDESDFDPLP